MGRPNLHKQALFVTAAENNACLKNFETEHCAVTLLELAEASTTQAPEDLLAAVRLARYLDCMEDRA